MLFWVYRKQKLHPWFTVSHALVETVRCLVLKTVYSHKWLVRRIYGLLDLVETIRNAFTEFTVWLVGITVSLFLVETTDGPHWVYVPCRFLQSPTIWLKLFLSGPHWVILPVGIHRLPTFGRSLLLALTEWIFLADSYSLPSLVEVVTADLFEHGAYP